MNERFIKQVAHVCVFAQDLARTEAFYVDVLGLEKAFDFNRGEDWIGFYLATGARTFVEVFRRDAVQFADSNPINHLCFETDDLDGLLAHVRAKGVTITDKKLGVDGTWQAWTADPDGAKIEIFQYTPESRQFKPHGGVCQVNW